MRFRVSSRVDRHDPFSRPGSTRNIPSCSLQLSSALTVWIELPDASKNRNMQEVPIVTSGIMQYALGRLWLARQLLGELFGELIASPKEKYPKNCRGNNRVTRTACWNDVTPGYSFHTAQIVG